MKLITFLLISVSIFAQNLEIVNIYESELPKEDLFVKSLSWANKTFKDSKEVVNYSDKESGVIYFKANFPISISIDAGKLLPRTTSGHVDFEGQIFIKDQKMKIVFSNIKQVGSVISAYSKYPEFGVLLESNVPSQNAFNGKTRSGEDINTLMYLAVKKYSVATLSEISENLTKEISTDNFDF